MGDRSAAQKTAKKRKNHGNGANRGFEATLWAAVCNVLLPRRLSGELGADDYKPDKNGDEED